MKSAWLPPLKLQLGGYNQKNMPEQPSLFAYNSWNVFSRKIMGHVVKGKETVLTCKICFANGEKFPFLTKRDDFLLHNQTVHKILS